MRVASRSSAAGHSLASTRRCRASRGNSAAVGQQHDDERLGPPSVAARSRTTSRAATIAVPHEPPDRIPSSRVSRRAIANASRSLTRTQRSITEASYVPGKKSSPTPSVRYGRAVSPDRTEPSGSAPMTWISGLRSLSTCPTPEMVPPVPTLATKWVIRPSVWSHSSGPVVRSWATGFSMFQYWSGLKAPGDVARQTGGDAVVRLGRLGRRRSSGRGPPRNRRRAGAIASRPTACRPSRRCSDSP